MWKVQNDSTPTRHARALPKANKACEKCLPSSLLSRAGAAQYSRDSGIVIVRNQAGRDKMDKNNILNI